MAEAWGITSGRRGRKSYAKDAKEEKKLKTKIKPSLSDIAFFIAKL
jgi:hypothetical protein